MILGVRCGAAAAGMADVPVVDGASADEVPATDALVGAAAAVGITRAAVEVMGRGAVTKDDTFVNMLAAGGACLLDTLALVVDAVRVRAAEEAG